MNSYFPQWTQLSFAYNALQNHYVNDRRAWKMEEVKVIHYVKYKPWMTKYGKEKLTEEQEKMFASLKELQSHWWHYHDILINSEP